MTIISIKDQSKLNFNYRVSSSFEIVEGCTGTFFGVMFGGHAVNGLKVPKWSQTKVPEKRENFLRPEVGPVEKPRFFSIFASELSFWLLAPKLSNLATWGVISLK